MLADFGAKTDFFNLASASLVFFGVFGFLFLLIKIFGEVTKFTHRGSAGGGDFDKIISPFIRKAQRFLHRLDFFHFPRFIDQTYLRGAYLMVDPNCYFTGDACAPPEGQEKRMASFTIPHFLARLYIPNVARIIATVRWAVNHSITAAFWRRFRSKARKQAHRCS